MTAEVVVVTFYSLRDPEGFDRAVRLLVPRVRLQGHEGLQSYRFSGTGPKERRLVAIYDSVGAWLGHHNLILPWPEMVALRTAARLARTDLYGPIPPHALQEVARMGLGRVLRHDGVVISGAPAEESRTIQPTWRRGNVWRRVG